MVPGWNAVQSGFAAGKKPAWNSKLHAGCETSAGGERPVTAYRLVVDGAGKRHIVGRTGRELRERDDRGCGSRCFGVADVRQQLHAEWRSAVWLHHETSN